jgi:hypothetical protein
MSRLLVLACSATKSAEPGLIPARERYTGPLWQTYRAADPHGRFAILTALSARYGWIDGDMPIENYDQKMTVDQIAKLGLTARWQLRALGDLSGVKQICVVGGSIYQDAADFYLDMVWRRYPTVRATRICDQIGYMRQQLRAWLTEQNLLEVAA